MGYVKLKHHLRHGGTLASPGIRTAFEPEQP